MIDITKLDLKSDIYKKTESIQEKFGLHIDQLGELDAEILDVLNGIAKPTDFVKHIQSRLEIDEDTAKKITDEVNQLVLEAIKAKLQLQAIEQAGGFEIERPDAPAVAAASPDKPVNLLANDSSIEQPVEAKRDIMAGIENPGPAPVRKEPLVEQLLRAANAMPEQQIVRETTAQPKKPLPPVPPQPAGSDPYREAID